MPRIIKTLGSLNFAIFLIASLGILLAISTFTESVYGTPFAQKLIYGAGWFDIFLSLVWTNIFFATWTRWPFKKQHIGFVITHIGILLLLFGALLSRLVGVEGQATIFENEEKNHILQEGFTVQISSNSAPDTFVNLNLKRKTPYELTLKNRPLKLTVDKIYEHANIILKIEQKDGLVDEFPLETGMNGTVSLSHNLKISNLCYFPNAKIENKKLVNAPDEINFNPAVEFDVLDEKGRRESHTKFAFFPEFESLRGGAKNNLFDLKINLEETSDSQAIQLTLDHDKNHPHWIVSDKPTFIETKNGSFKFQLQQKMAPLPFSLTLKDFRKTDYPGTSSPASFESDVILHDNVKKIRIEKTISMNKPLDYEGYRVFQSSYIQDETYGEASVFTIAKNPGIRFIYSGALIILSGVITLFYLHPFFSGKDYNKP